MGVCIDTGHAFLAGEMPTIAQKLSSHLWMVHASDNRGQFDDHLAPGDGHINWEEFLYHLAEIRFGGTIILEISGTGTSASILQAAQRGRKHLNGIARHLTETQAAVPRKSSVP